MRRSFPARCSYAVLLAGSMLAGCADSSSPPGAGAQSAPRAMVGAHWATARPLYESGRSSHDVSVETAEPPIARREILLSALDFAPPPLPPAPVLPPANSMRAAKSPPPTPRLLPPFETDRPGLFRLPPADEELELAAPLQQRATPWPEPVTENLPRHEVMAAPPRFHAPRQAPDALAPSPGGQVWEPAGAGGERWIDRDVIAGSALQLTRRAAEAARRGAVYSAQADLIQALQLIAQALDVEQPAAGHAESLRRGLRALEEAADFLPTGSATTVGASVPQRVRSHRTTILRTAMQPLDRMSPLVAIQHYLQYAQQQLALAGGDLPAASVALYALGRLQFALAGDADPQGHLAAPRAIACYDAALGIDSRNHLAANELGVLLARCGRLPAARDALRQAVAHGGGSESWHNLAVVHERLGEVELAAQARRQSELARRPPESPGTQSDVTWVEAEVFAGRTSPTDGDGSRKK
ncbi:MAG: hypothetical protein J5I93_14840 [Pirellulaceae bacterium]|nr:hypothetical protein [Pirellulaceae bacterium]